MTIERKLLGTNPSGGGGGTSSNVADVFSTHLYTGNATPRTITNGIDLNGEGGLIWTKQRKQGLKHRLADTTRSLSQTLYTNTTGPASNGGGVGSLNSDGYNLLANATGYINTYDQPYVSWTFRNSPKFFQALSYTGDSSGGRTISHSLKSAPAMLIVKSTNTDQDWFIYHSHTGSGKFLNFTDGTGTVNANAWNNTTPTDTEFSIGSFLNITGRSYVAYLFADNSGEDLNNQMIKCGSYTGDGTNSHVHTDLGWEPQFVLIKNITTSQGDPNWHMLDTTRGWGAQESSSTYCGAWPLYANVNNSESTQTNQYFGGITSTGFSMYTINVSSPGTEYLYMAIRAPMMKEPEDAAEVFALDTSNSTGDGEFPHFRSDFAVDMVLRSYLNGSFSTSNNYLASRLTGKEAIRTDDNDAGQGLYDFDYYTFDHSNGFQSGGSTLADTADFAWLWKRAKGFMDVVTWNGDSVAGREIPHSLGVIPEMMWVKCRNASEYGPVYHKDLGTNNNLFIQLDNGMSQSPVWNNTAPTETVFTLDDNSRVNSNLSTSRTYIAYLFASVAGVSKVGSYVGNGGFLPIDCGFAAGARFVLIKRTAAQGDWYMWNTLKGIVYGMDPHWILNDTAAIATNSSNTIDPRSGFAFSISQESATNLNVSGETYIFYAIA